MHGMQERQRLLEEKLPGTERVLRERPKGVREGKLLDALADLWTARRIMARAITRLSDPPVWDTDGVRMDIVC
jgi:predicted RNase H-like nuclease